MFMFMSIGISYAETVHSQNAAMEFRFQDVTIEKALKEIEKKTGYNFFYNTKDFNVKQKISFSAKGMNLSEVLNGIFANSQVDYVINGTDIVLKRREEVSNVSNEKYQIKGTVRDGNGEPVIGASVVLKVQHFYIQRRARIGCTIFLRRDAIDTGRNDIPVRTVI